MVNRRGVWDRSAWRTVLAYTGASAWPPRHNVKLAIAIVTATYTTIALLVFFFLFGSPYFPLIVYLCISYQGIVDLARCIDIHECD